MTDQRFAASRDGTAAGIAAMTAIVALMCGALLMRPLKGMVIGAQWALKMHGFGGHAD